MTGYMKQVRGLYTLVLRGVNKFRHLIKKTDLKYDLGLVYLSDVNETQFIVIRTATHNTFFQEYKQGQHRHVH